MLITTVYSSDFRNCLFVPPSTFFFKKGMKTGNGTFQMSAHCEDSKGDFILHHFTEDNHNHVTVALRMYYMLQSRMPYTAWKGSGWKATSVLSLKSVPMQDLSATETKWSKQSPPEGRYCPYYPNLTPSKENIQRTVLFSETGKKFSSHNKFSFDQKGLSPCALQPVDGGKWQVARTTLGLIRQRQVNLRRQTLQNT